MDGKESEAAEKVRPDKQQQGTGNNGGCGGYCLRCERCCPCCDRLTSLLESRVVKRVRLDDNQRDGGDGNESETVENDKEPSGDDRQRRARKVMGVGLSSGGRHYRRHRDDPEWRAAQAAKRAQREPPKPIDPQRMSTLMKLLDVVLEVEPWNIERHGRNTGRAWAECGERVPAYLENCRARPHRFVQQNAVRMVRQLYAPKSLAARKWSPEVNQRVQALADKLAADPHYRDKFTRPTEDPAHGKPGTPQQQQERERGEPEGTVASV